MPYTLISAMTSREMIKTAAGLKTHDIAANGHLHRVLTLCGLGVCFTGVSHHGSMGEHQVSHWIDMFAGDAHPGTTHGQQVGVASLAIARLHHELLALDQPPLIRATHIVESEFIQRYGPDIGRMCYAEAKKKSFDRAGAEAFNRKLKDLWPQLREELRPMLMDPSEDEGDARRRRRPDHRDRARPVAQGLARCDETRPRRAQPLVLPGSCG